MEAWSGLVHDETSAAPSTRTRQAVDVVSSVKACQKHPNSALPCALQRPQQRRPILLPRAAAARTPAVRLGWRSGCPRRAWKAFDVGWGARVRAWAYRCLRCLSWGGGGVSNAGAERSPKMSTAARGLTGMPHRNRNITCGNITCRNIRRREVMMCTH